MCSEMFDISLSGCFKAINNFELNRNLDYQRHQTLLATDSYGSIPQVGIVTTLDCIKQLH